MVNSKGLARGSRGPRGPYRCKPQVIRGERRGRGRPKGSRNALTRAISDAIIVAAEQVGEDGKGKGGLVGYLKRVAKKDHRAFCPLLGRALPLQVKVENRTEVRYKSADEVRAELEARGIPIKNVLQLEYHNTETIEGEVVDSACAGERKP
jgi:hypothetical protein